MLSKELKRILKLARRTKDRVVVYDSNNPDDSFVISPLDQYVDKLEAVEKESVGDNNIKKEELTEDNITDKINRELANWKNRSKKEELEEDSGPGKTWSIPSNIVKKAEDIQ